MCTILQRTVYLTDSQKVERSMSWLSPLMLAVSKVGVQ